ncbi:hypothetical protein CDV36_008163 [Fusarium kuroshium]|uniref:Uncharacterized protein n=1 Tax=Fusarium kuroshium TaxID=2010991 RepID=A0A3M2S4L2_9HYPO|nr:hypothetical protein CDV36_008163 [Fusarium kuroshium]
MVQRVQLRGQIESREILFPSDLKCSLLKQFTARTHGISTFAAVKSCADEIEASNRGATGWRSRTLGPGCPGRYMGKARGLPGLGIFASWFNTSQAISCCLLFLSVIVLLIKPRFQIPGFELNQAGGYRMLGWSIGA